MIVGVTSTIISTASGLFFDEFLHVNRAFQPTSLLKEKYAGWLNKKKQGNSSSGGGDGTVVSYSEVG